MYFCIVWDAVSYCKLKLSFQERVQMFREKFSHVHVDEFSNSIFWKNEKKISFCNQFHLDMFSKISFCHSTILSLFQTFIFFKERESIHDTKQTILPHQTQSNINIVIKRNITQNFKSVRDKREGITKQILNHISKNKLCVIIYSTKR